MDFRARATRLEQARSRYIRASPLFDARYYLDQVHDPEAASDPALHYLLEGEAHGAAASARFDAANYVELNPDVAQAAMNCLIHFEVYGRAEGRRTSFESDNLELDDSRMDAGKPTVLLLLHEATYTGAPILGWNITRELKLTRNVVVMLRRGGALSPALAAAATALVGPPPPEIADNPVELARLAARLKTRYRPLYVIANSSETRLFGAALRAQGVPLISLVHEFATNAPPYALSDFYRMSDCVVFPAEVVRQSSLQSYDYGVIAQRRTVILPQGPSAIPRLIADARRSAPEPVHASGPHLADLLGEADPPFTIVGLGAVDLRKGVDLFVATASALKARDPTLAFRFIWVGDRPHPLPHAYYTFLDEQVSRSGLQGQLVLADAVDDLEPIYAAADAFFLSSRLDPLPNVGIDAARRGVPILCFRDATGFAELLEQDARTSWLVAPYMDTGAVAESLALLARDDAMRESACAAVKAMAVRRFNMVRYAAELDALGRAAAQRHAKRERQVDTLLADDAFDAALYLGSAEASSTSREAAVRRYLDDTLNVDFSGPAVWGHHPRRAMPGFHPLMYGHLAPDFNVAEGTDPLVDFISRGRPVGSWAHDVVKLEERVEPFRASRTTLRAAIHGHFHYVDNFIDLLTALKANEHDFDLLLTTNSRDHADFLRAAALEHYGRGQLSVEVGPNRGRDIGPFLALLHDRLQDYDVVAHLHGKRSVHTFHYDAELGNRWRHFLWQHLVGPAAPVADIILERFAEVQDLGLVFPENDLLVGWEKNRALAENLASRMGLSNLPEHIEFPVGTMFWARPAALKRLAEANFTTADYPPEPLPIDGTMLHALERMLPLVVESAGYRYMTTYFPQFTR